MAGQIENGEERTVSAARLKANRENAQKSTGPTSKGGKAASRLNATQHGLLSETPILPGEDDAQRAALHERMVEDLAPVGAFEEELVAKIASAMWRLRRFERIETALYAYRLLEDCRQDGIKATKPIVLGRPLDIPGMVAPRPDYDDGVILTVMSESLMEKPGLALGRAFLRDLDSGNALGNLGRYETAQIRNLQRLRDQLDKSQSSRTS